MIISLVPSKCLSVWDKNKCLSVLDIAEYDTRRAKENRPKADILRVKIDIQYQKFLKIPKFWPYWRRYIQFWKLQVEFGTKMDI